MQCFVKTEQQKANIIYKTTCLACLKEYVDIKKHKNINSVTRPEEHDATVD